MERLVIINAIFAFLVQQKLPTLASTAHLFFGAVMQPHDQDSKNNYPYIN